MKGWLGDDGAEKYSDIVYKRLVSMCCYVICISITCHTIECILAEFLPSSMPDYKSRFPKGIGKSL